MNKEEKIHIMKNCQYYFQKAIMTKHIDDYAYFLNIGRAIELKELIEKFIDCQSKPYYDMYQNIVKLRNQIIE